MLEGTVTLSYHCNICRRDVNFQLRLTGLDVRKVESKSALGSDYYIWEGQCPHCFNWNEVKL